MVASWLTDVFTTDLDRALHYTHLWGFEWIELRTVGGRSERVPDVNIKKLVRRLHEQDIQVAAIRPSLLESPIADSLAWRNELSDFGEIARFCEKVRVDRIILAPFTAACSASPDQISEALHALDRKCASAGITATIQHGPDTAFSTLRDVIAQLETGRHQHLQVAATFVPNEHSAGEDPDSQVARQHVHQLGHIYVTSASVHTPAFTEFLGAVAAEGYAGAVSLLMEDGVSQALKASTALHLALRAAAKHAATRAA